MIKSRTLCIKFAVLQQLLGEVSMADDVHRIRLHGPWEVSRNGPSGVEFVKMKIPCRWLDAGWAGFSGRAVYVRKFGSPRQLDPGEEVWLVLRGVTGSGRISINQHELARFEQSDEPKEFEITNRLQGRNELQITLSSDSDEGGIWGEVLLEFRSPQKKE